jgi:hypothetical protein
MGNVQTTQQKHEYPPANQPEMCTYIVDENRMHLRPHRFDECIKTELISSVLVDTYVIHICHQL